MSYGTSVWNVQKQTGKIKIRPEKSPQRSAEPSEREREREQGNPNWKQTQGITPTVLQYKRKVTADFVSLLLCSLGILR